MAAGGHPARDFSLRAWSCHLPIPGRCRTPPTSRDGQKMGCISDSFSRAGDCLSPAAPEKYSQSQANLKDGAKQNLRARLGLQARLLAAASPSKQPQVARVTPNCLPTPLGIRQESSTFNHWGGRAPQAREEAPQWGVEGSEGAGKKYSPRLPAPSALRAPAPPRLLVHYCVSGKPDRGCGTEQLRGPFPGRNKIILGVGFFGFSFVFEVQVFVLISYFGSLC